MQVYRLAKAKHIRDLSGAGARIAGGRWNLKGTAVLYTAESRALATVEYLVHVPIAIIPRNLRMAAIDVPDAAPRIAEELKAAPILPAASPGSSSATASRRSSSPRAG